MLGPLPKPKVKTLRHSIESKRSLESIYSLCEDVDKFEREKLLNKIDKTIDNVNNDARHLTEVYDKYVGQFEIY